MAIQVGSYDQKNGSVTLGSQLQTSSHLVHFSKNTSEGYRFNTDFDNQNYFLKSSFNTDQFPITMLASFSERKSGANGFYSSPSAINQHEETQTSLIGFSTEIKSKQWIFKPRLYWKRNQDEYIFVRHNPSIYRNLHQTNKVSAEFNAFYTSNLGITGFGIDISQVYISSNNLGQYNRLMTTLFLEHRFEFLEKKLDITPGIAATYFSDFNFMRFQESILGMTSVNNSKSMEIWVIPTEFPPILICIIVTQPLLGTQI